MKLLLENWRKYLAESEAQHFPWLKDLAKLGSEPELADRLKDRLQAGDDRFKILGAGAFRTVWAPRGDNDHVIKVVHELDDYKLQMNEDDFNTAKRYPLIFPRAYAHADDFSWIAMERITPAIYPEDMQKILDQSFPAEQEALLNTTNLPDKDALFGDQWNLADPFHILKMILGSFRYDRTKDPSTDKSKSAEIARNLQDVLVPVAGPAYQELSKAMHEFNIDKYEIGRGNIGYDSEGNFKIIDSSVFDPDWGGDA
jgi:hypothetical protein